jgi:hypothetical protein
MFAQGCEEVGGVEPPWSGDVYERPENVEMVVGWALDIGSRTDMGGVAYVQLLLDGSLLSDTNEGSFYWEPADWDFNYYGHERMDVFRLYSDVPNAKHSGFSFLMDISYLILARGYSEGLHLIKVRAGDRENNVTDIAQLPVIFDCNDDEDDPAWGDIWTPEHMELVAGTVEVTGFVMDSWRIDYVEIWVDKGGPDESFVGYADYPLSSPDLADLYPWMPPWFSSNSGYSYDLDTVAENLADGEHRLVVITEDRLGGRTIIGERRFVLDNQSP